jgi:hypothetical protein
MDEAIWFAKGPTRVFLSHRTLIEEILLFMMKRTIQKFVFLFINVATSIIVTFDLWIKKVHSIPLPLSLIS